MSAPGELLIVDNSVEGWSALQYLEQWTEIAKSFDIATGYFEIGALLACRLPDREGEEVSTSEDTDDTGASMAAEEGSLYGEDE